MTKRDVLIERVFQSDGTPVGAVPFGKDDVGEELWRVSTRGKPTQILYPFTVALDVALEWVATTGGEIYRLETFGGTPALYKPSS
jgi:hypothetical protein